MRSERSVSTVDPGGTFTSAARRAQFVAAAIDTIAEVGYARASLGRIAERVGVSKGVISYHFAGKGELVREMIADIAAKGGEFVYENAMTEPTTPRRLRAWFESTLSFMAAHRREMVAYFEIAVGSRGDAAVTAAVAELRTGVGAALRDMLAAGQVSGELRQDFDPQAVAMAIMAIVEAIPPLMVRDPGFDIARYGREIADLFDIATRRAAPRETGARLRGEGVRE